MIGGCRVMWRLSAAREDGTDQGNEPDLIPEEGAIVRLTPSIGNTLVSHSADGKQSIWLDDLYGVIDSARNLAVLDQTTMKPLPLPLFCAATDDPGLSVTGWVWDVWVRRPGSQHEEIKVGSFAAPAGGTVNLADAVTAPADANTRAWVDKIPELLDIIDDLEKGPEGKQGAQGVGISEIRNPDATGVATIVLTDPKTGATTEVPLRLPAGPVGPSGNAFPIYQADQIPSVLPAGRLFGVIAGTGDPGENPDLSWQLPTIKGHGSLKTATSYQGIDPSSPSVITIGSPAAPGDLIVLFAHTGDDGAARMLPVTGMTEVIRNDGRFMTNTSDGNVFAGVYASGTKYGVSTDVSQTQLTAVSVIVISGAGVPITAVTRPRKNNAGSSDPDQYSVTLPAFSVSQPSLILFFAVERTIAKNPQPPQWSAGIESLSYIEDGSTSETANSNLVGYRRIESAGEVPAATAAFSTPHANNQNVAAIIIPAVKR